MAKRRPKKRRPDYQPPQKPKPKREPVEEADSRLELAKAQEDSTREKMMQAAQMMHGGQTRQAVSFLPPRIAMDYFGGADVVVKSSGWLWRGEGLYTRHGRLVATVKDFPALVRAEALALAQAERGKRVAAARKALLA